MKPKTQQHGLSDKVVLYTGRRGEGKTLTMVAEGLQYYLNGYDVYRNFSAKFGVEIGKRHLYEIDQHNIQNAVIMIDELHLFYDSRQFMKKRNIEFSKFLAKLRKKNIIVMGTVQFKDNTEYRIRQHCDVEASMKTDTKNGVVHCVYIDKTKIQNSFMLDKSNEIFDKVLNRSKGVSHISVIYDVNPIFDNNIYDTNEEPI